MTGKIALEEHFAIPDYNRHRPPFLGDDLWQQVRRRIVDFTEIRLPEMDRHGIDFAVISLTSPGVQGETDPAVAVERARRANDVLAEAVQAHPHRFGGFAAVPLQDVDAAVVETTRAVTELGFHGVLVNSWTNEPDAGVGYLDESRFDPFWARLEELGVPLYLHPRQLPTHQREVVEGFPALAGPVWEFAAGCSATALRLMLSGLFDRRPGLQVILGHLGEGLPYDIWRTENRRAVAGDRPVLRRTLTDYLRENVYLTTSGHFCTPSLRAALEVVGTDRVMFSVDYPYESTEQAASWFDGLDLDHATRSAVAADNAVRLLGLKPRDAVIGGSTMAELVAVIASTHHPFYYRASTASGEDRPPFADEWVRRILAFRETLTRARPDVLVMVGSDHFHQLWLDNMPQFLVGKAPTYDANWYNEEREFGLPRMLLQGQEDLSAYVLREGLDAGFDLAFSNELRIDHSITCPIITLRPDADLPIVPIYTNIFAPPLPQPTRFVQLGRTLRQLVESWPSDQRVAVIGTGHLSLELGGPRQFGPHGPDPQFDQKAVEWIASGDIEGCLAEVTLDSLHLPGNATHGFMDFLLMMGIAGEGQKADYVDSLDLFHTMEAYFTWYPQGGAG